MPTVVMVRSTGRTIFSTLFVVVAMPLAGTALQAQGAVITGRVTSEFGVPLDGANVFITEMSVSIPTDADGRYTVALPASRVRGQSVVLRARSIGYASQGKQIAVTEGTQTHDFTLRRDVNRLDEIVITGSVTATPQKKLAFSVARLDESDMPVPATNPLQQLQGKVPGAHIVLPTGRPGASPSVLLRGPKSIDATGRSQEPLYIVDGVVMNSGLQEINPLDIESIEVVKGAAASSLYGSRAGAGVIQIMTKNGARGPQGTRMTVRSELGFRDVQGEYDYGMRHSLIMDERNERFCIKQTGYPTCSRTIDFEEETRRINDTTSAGALPPHLFERDYGISAAPSETDAKGLFQINQWPKLYDPVAQVVTEGMNVSNAVDLSARSGGTAYFASLSQLSEEGAVRLLKGYRRSSGRLNVDQSIGGDVTLALSSMFTRSTRFPAWSGPVGDFGEDNFFRITRLRPSVDYLRRDRLGRLYIRANPLARGIEAANPFYDFENAQGQLDVDRFLASLTGRYAPTDWLSVDATAATDRLRSSEEAFIDRGYRTVSNLFEGLGGSISQEAVADLSYNVAFGGRANFGVGPDLRAAVTARSSYEQEDVNSTLGQGIALAVPGLRTLSNATTNIIIRSSARSIRAKGILGGAQLEYKERYILDGLLRYDGSSLFGASERWHPYYRASLAWRMSDEDFWPVPDFANDVKLRGSVGTAGGRPNFVAQYETFALGAGGAVTAQTLGNKNLKPEKTLETEYGVDAELLNRFGISFTYARDITTDQLLLVPAPLASGYPEQWLNAGTLDGKTYELALRIPIMAGPTFSWNSQIAWDRSRTYIAALNRPPYFSAVMAQEGGGVRFLIAPGERIGTIYGHRFATRCSELPAPFDAQCGAGLDWQVNDEGYVVWVGEGQTWREGITLNLWQAVRPGCVKDGVKMDAIGEDQCRSQGGTVNAPWGTPDVHWGMPIVLRDSTANPIDGPLGNTLPDFRVSMSHSIQWKRFSFYGLVDVSVGNDVYNHERQWSLGDFTTREVDQDGKTPETAKPIGYYWRASAPTSIGVGGFYDQLGANNRTLEDGSYAKLREASLTYDLREVLGLGNWSVSLVARNLYTWTRYSGWDPEVGLNSGGVNSAVIGAGGMFQYPPTRAYTLAISSRF